MVHKINLVVNDALFKQLITHAGSADKIPTYITNILANLSDYNPNVENSNFVGRIISGASIIKHFNTVIMGGSNYPYHLTNTSKINKDDIYRIINFDNGAFTLKKIN